jgi:flagellar basal-body rod protein FlgC
MSLEKILDINASGMKAQMLRMEVLSSNIANINATRTAEGGPYRRKDALNAAAGNSGTQIGVQVTKVVDDPSPFKKKYDPGHPDAGPDGYVLFPNVDVVSEMVNVQEAARSYEANIAVILAVKNMIAKTFEIGRR